ncbi:MAG: DUF1178 family protein [Burkholderiaceae bacterium]
MKVFNLECENGHGFEGWFASAEAFEEQSGNGLLCCPLCDATRVRRLPSAPRLNLSNSQEPGRPGDDSRQVMAQPTPAQLQSLWLKMVEHIERHTEDVGERFAEEARRIHYQEAPERGIRGHASREDAQALADEGIEVMAFPIPSARKGPVQ